MIATAERRPEEWRSWSRFPWPDPRESPSAKSATPAGDGLGAASRFRFPRDPGTLLAHRLPGQAVPSGFNAPLPPAAS